MIQSQENCLFDNHRFTHERWGGDLRDSFMAHISSQCFLTLGFFMPLYIYEKGAISIIYCDSPPDEKKFLLEK